MASSREIRTSPLMYPISLSSRWPQTSSVCSSLRPCRLASCRAIWRICRIASASTCSGMADSRQSDHQLMKHLPLPRPILQRGPAVQRQAVILSPASAGPFLPAALDQAFSLELVQDGIDGPFLPGQRTVGLLVDLPD